MLGKWAIGVALIGFLIVITFPMNSYATTPPGFYGSDTSGNIFLFDPTTPSITPLGNTGTLFGSTEIECTNDGTLCFSQTPDGAFLIEEVFLNPPVLAGAPVVDGAAFNGLEYVGSTLFGTSIPSGCFPSVLSTLNPVTGASVLIGPTNTGRPMSGLAFDTVNNIMFGVDGCGSAGPSNLSIVDLSTGNALLVGNTGVRLGSLEFGPDGLLYGGGDTADGGNIYRINTGTGLATQVVLSGFPQVTGLTLVPSVSIGGTLVPIDTTALLLAGVQSISMWMIPVVAAGIVIGVFVIKRRK